MISLLKNYWAKTMDDRLSFVHFGIPKDDYIFSLLELLKAKEKVIQHYIDEIEELKKLLGKKDE